MTLPFIEGERFTIDWVYNILDHKKESERIVYEDPDPETGSISGPNLNNLCRPQVYFCPTLTVIQQYLITDLSPKAWEREWDKEEHLIIETKFSHIR